MPPYNLSPSRIARYYHFGCDRFLRYAATPGSHRQTDGVPKPPQDGNPVARAVLEGGYAWEDRLLDEHLAARIHVAPGDPAHRRDLAWTVEESVLRLQDVPVGGFLYQPTLRTPPAFYDRFQLDAELLSFSDCRPDLIEVREANGRRLLRVHDAKASSHQKLTHRVQVALYALIIETLLEDAGLEAIGVDPVGGVWLAGEDEPGLFDIDRVRSGLEAFIRNRLTAIFTESAANAFWHLNFRCEWCEWFESCRDEAEATRDVSLVPNLTIHARRYLAQLDPPLDTLDAFGNALCQDDADEVLAGVASLAGKRLRLRKLVNSLAKDSPFAIGGASVSLPRGENVRFVLTLQTEPVGGRVYVWGFHRTGGRGVFGEDAERTIIRVAANDHEETLLTLHREFVRELHDRLLRVHQHNDGLAFEEKLSLQCYVFDTYEESLLLGILVGLLDDPDVGPLALDLFFHFQSPELLAAQAHPDGAVFFPLVVLNRIVKDLVALPVPVVYRFADVNRLLQPEEFGSQYKESDFFTFRYSNQLKSDAIFHAWTKERADLLDAVSDEIGRRLRGADSVLRGFRERAEKHPHTRLVAYAPKFRLPATVDIADPYLSRLAFVVRFEEISRCLAARERRTRPFEERLAAGSVIPFIYQKDGRYRTSRPVDIDWDELFPRYLLSAHDEPGESAQMRYDDFGNKRSVRPPKHAVALAEVVDRVPDPTEHGHAWYRLQLKASRGFPGLHVGGSYLLHERFTDWTSPKLLDELRALDEEPAPCSLARLVTDPGRYRGTPPDVDVLHAPGLALGKQHGMTSSQLAAFDGVLRHTLQLVWGPPGTGKTWFLAMTVLSMLEASRQAGRPCRVVVTAFTHAAIDNLLRRIRKLQKERAVLQEKLAIGKCVRSEDPGAGIQAVPKNEAFPWLCTNERAVLGATVWRLLGTVPPGDASLTDLVVVDEASQVKVAEAALAVRRIRTGGRLVLAGDHRQLPPIVQGTYPDPEPGEPLLHRSIFEAVRAADPEGACSATLLENFRMCKELCRFPAETLYHPDYRPANDDIANQRLAFDATKTDDPFVARALDPSNPLVVVIIDGVRATAENVFEAELAGRLGLALREQAGLPDGDDGDRRFWSDHLFVVTPHHVQRRAVVRALQGGRDWQVPPFVDTVDKMQGQECAAVIVSYGVSDLELALREKEFIYSLERLNVAITRAQKKCVVFLPRPLLEPDLEAFADDDVAEGIAFMQRLPAAADDVIVVNPSITGAG